MQGGGRSTGKKSSTAAARPTFRSKAAPPQPQETPPPSPLSGLASLVVCTLQDLYGGLTDPSFRYYVVAWIAVIIGIVTFMSFQLAEQLDFFKNGPNGILAGDLVMVDELHPSTRLYNMDGEEIGARRAMKVISVSLDTPMEDLARLHKIRLNLTHLESGRPLTLVHFRVTGAFKEARGDRVLIYVTKPYTTEDLVVIMGRAGRMQLRSMNNSEIVYGVKPMRLRKQHTDYWPETEGTIYCAESDCPEGCSIGHFMSSDSDGLKICQPCMPDSVSDISGLFPGLCFCVKNSELWSYDGQRQQCRESSSKRSSTGKKSQSKIGKKSKKSKSKTT